MDWELSIKHLISGFIPVVNGASKPWRNDEGYVIMGMKYFLLR